MKVAWFEEEEWHREYIESSREIDFYPGTVQFHEEEGLEKYDAIAVRSNSQVDREVLENLRPKKVLCRSSGHDNVDLEAAEEVGSKVYNVVDYGSETVAEYVFALILSVSKNLFDSRGKDPNKVSGTECFELKDAVLGVLGAGNIGKEVIKRGNAFGMETIAYDPYKDLEAAESIGYSYVELETLLSEADIISINCPLNSSTRNILSKKQFDLMEDVILVNTARGAVIDTEALIQGLNKGNVRMAALDVLEEGYFDQLSDNDDVMVTPHNGYNTRKAKERRIDATLENLNSEKGAVDPDFN